MFCVATIYMLQQAFSTPKINNQLFPGGSPEFRLEDTHIVRKLQRLVRNSKFSRYGDDCRFNSVLFVNHDSQTDAKKHYFEGAPEFLVVIMGGKHRKC